MKLAVFSTRKWVSNAFDALIPDYEFEVEYFEVKLDRQTASLAKGFDAVCVFVNDQLDAQTIEKLHANGIRCIVLRCAGFNNVDLAKAEQLNIPVLRVPAYSPYAVAEHTLGMMLCLNRKFHRAHNRVREGNFALQGLLGFDIYGKTIGIIGTGKIGQIMAQLLTGFQGKIIAYDPYPNEELQTRGVEYVSLEQIYRQSDIITLHCPLTADTYHVINKYAISLMKRGVMIINTSRGALIDAQAVIDGIKEGTIGYLGLDVYEEEGDIFFEDLSDEVIPDDTFVRLQTFPNVLITGHQAFFTREAVANIAETTCENLKAVAEDKELVNVVKSS